MKKLLLAVLLLFTCITASHAEDTGISGFDALTLKLPADGSGVFSVAGSQMLGQWQTYLTLENGYERHIISARRNNRPIWLDDYAFTGNLMAAVGFFDFLSAGVDIPFTWVESVKNANTANQYYEKSLGDIHFEIKGRLLKQNDGWRPGIAFIPSIFFPSGDTKTFTGNTGFRYEGLLVVDKDFGPVYVALNTGYRFVQKKTVITTTINDQLLFGAGVRVPLAIWKEHFDFLFEGTGSTVVTNLSSDTTSFEILSGFDKKFSNGLGVNLVGGAGIQKTLGTPEFRVLAGLNYKLPKSSR